MQRAMVLTSSVARHETRRTGSADVMTGTVVVSVALPLHSSARAITPHPAVRLYESWRSPMPTSASGAGAEMLGGVRSTVNPLERTVDDSDPARL